MIVNKKLYAKKTLPYIKAKIVPKLFFLSGKYKKPLKFNQKKFYGTKKEHLWKRDALFIFSHL
jgi:hypothetical protein